MSLPARTHIPSAALHLRGRLTPIFEGEAVVIPPEDVRGINDLLMRMEWDGHDLIKRCAELQQRSNDLASELARAVRQVERLSGRPWRKDAA